MIDSAATFPQNVLSGGGMAEVPSMGIIKRDLQPALVVMRRRPRPERRSSIHADLLCSIIS
jgi:hypothetical protein